MDNKSHMVVATKFKLTKPISIKKGTWNKDSGKEKVHTKILPRRVVESRNEHDNNEHYIIDEEATENMLKKREKNIIANAAKEKREKTSTADIVEAIQTMGTKKVEYIEGDGETLFKDMTEDQLRHYSSYSGIEQHHKSGKEKLIETINEFNSKK